MAMTKGELIACVLRAHEAIGSEADLSPRNPRINETLSALVRVVLEGCPPDDARAVLDHPKVRAIRSRLIERLAIAEGEMERCWSERFCARAGLAAADLAEFTYWDCYRRLVGAELGGLPARLELDEEESIAFVGAGPLPLSAIVMHLHTGTAVTCIDRDAAACALAGELCRKAGWTGISVTCADGADYDFARSPVVFIASLVPEKASVMRCIREGCPRACVAIRSAEGLRTLLYDPVDEAELDAMGCGYLGRTGHDPQVINTTLFYEAVPAAARGADIPTQSVSVRGASPTPARSQPETPPPSIRAGRPGAGAP
jgi:hypothetical protein